MPPCQELFVFQTLHTRNFDSAFVQADISRGGVLHDCTPDITIISPRIFHIIATVKQQQLLYATSILQSAAIRQPPSHPYRKLSRQSCAIRAGKVWALLEGGGHVYVCGDAKHMARDVHRTLIELVQRQTGCSGTQAEARLKQLADSGRYQRDVW